MPRTARLASSYIIYHIISRGNRGEKIFLDDSDYKRFFDLLEKIKIKYDHQLLAFCPMPNHIHLLIRTRKSPLSKIMASLLLGYVRYFNTKYEVGGHLFGDRYKSIICQKEKYLWDVVRYIFLNPVKAGLVKCPEDYRWSSYQEFLGRGKNHLTDITDRERLIKLLGCDPKRLSKYVNEKLLDIEALEYPKISRGQIVGGKRFIKKMEKILEKRGQKGRG